MNCKPGDLAVVVRSRTSSNVGKIVHVLARHAIGDSRIVSVDEDLLVWLCHTAGSPLRWQNAVGGGEAQSDTGPIPDSCLRPLRPGDEPAARLHQDELGQVA